MKLRIINYGAGNIKSIQFAFQRLGVDARLSNDSKDLLSADKIIFPGVGQASNAMKMLQASRLDALIPDLQQPVLGICLGMQLLCQSSEEGNTTGLGVFQTSVKRFSNNQKVPQIGWNVINNLKSELFKGIQENTYMYLVHSYYAEHCDQTIATTDYGLNYASALQHKNFYGVQFHPEKSGVAGAQLLENFLKI